MRPEQALAALPGIAMEPRYTKVRCNQAFKALQKMGYIARQNYTCCRSCAGAAIAEEVAGWNDAKRNKLKGAVYYHQQDYAGAFGGNTRVKRSTVGELHVRYGQVGVINDDRTTCWYGKSDLEIGQDVAEALRNAGLYVQWNGDPARTIVVEGLDQTIIDAAAAVVRLGGDYEDVLNNRASGK